MKRISFDERGEGLAEALDWVAPDREVVIKRPGGGSVVLVPLRDYEALTETMHLMGAPANSRRLLDAMERLESGRGEQHDLIDAD